jgi:hypothetical protein
MKFTYKDKVKVTHPFYGVLYGIVDDYRKPWNESKEETEYYVELYSDSKFQYSLNRRVDIKESLLQYLCNNV